MHAIAAALVGLILLCAFNDRRLPLQWAMFTGAEKAFLWRGPSVLRPEVLGVLPDTDNLALRHLQFITRERPETAGFEGYVMSTRRGSFRVRYDTGESLAASELERAQAYAALASRLERIS